MVDIHSHILPAVDDGAKSWEIAVEMCRMASEDGIEHIVATPHANNQYQYDRRSYQDLLQQLRERVGASPALSLGCDFHLSYENMNSLAEEPEDFTIEKTPYLLVELSDFSISPAVTEQFVGLIRAGLRPIITHPERNPLLASRPERIVEWVRLGCAIQVTASAVTGKWGPTAKSVAHWLIGSGAAHILASDSHDLRRRRPNLSDAHDVTRRKYSRELAKALVDDNPRAVIEGKELPYFPQV